MNGRISCSGGAPPWHPGVYPLWVWGWGFRVQVRMVLLKCRVGFTLVETLVVVACLSVLLAFSLPGLLSMVRSVQLSLTRDAFQTSLQLARLEAVRSNGRVVMCKSASGDSCTSTGGWRQGWIVFADSDNNAQADPGERILYREGAQPASVSISAVNSVADYVSYSGQGRALLLNGAMQMGTFTLCTISETELTGYRLPVTSVGRSHVQKTVVPRCGE